MGAITDNGVDELYRLREKVDRGVKGGIGVLIDNTPTGILIRVPRAAPGPPAAVPDVVTRMQVTTSPVSGYPSLFLAQVWDGSILFGTGIPIVARRYHKVGDELLAVQPKGGPAGGPYTYGGDAVTWEEVPGGFSWGKASADYTHATGSDSYVDVHPCGDRDGANADTNTTVRVYLPSTAGRCPNVRQNDVVGYAYDRGGVAVATTDVLDDVVGAVKAWSGSVAALPAGWSLCDGTNGTPNLSGRFVVGYDVGDGDYDTLGNSGGNKTHTHTTHDPHTLTVSADSVDTPAGSPFGGPYPLVQCVGPTTLTHSAHDTVDHRPPYYVLAWIMRVQ